MEVRGPLTFGGPRLPGRSRALPGPYSAQKLRGCLDVSLGVSLGVWVGCLGDFLGVLLGVWVGYMGVGVEPKHPTKHPEITPKHRPRHPDTRP